MDCSRLGVFPRVGDKSVSVNANQRLGTGHSFSTFSADGSCRQEEFSWQQTSDNSMQSPGHEQQYVEDCDFSDPVLRYISQILMEEDIDDKSFMLQDSPDLQIAEKSLYEVLGQKYPPPPEKNQTSCISQNEKHPAGSSISQHCASINVNSSGQIATNSSRIGRRKSHGREEGGIGGEEEERSRKQAAVSADSELRSERFDLVLLSSGGEGLAHLMSLRASLKDGVSKNLHATERPKRSNARRGRRKKQKEEELMDVRSLLIQCAHTVASNDIRSTNSLLEKIRRYASPFGDGTQRLAQCFADGLEARLAGTGSDICRGLIHKRRTASEMLKGYQLFLAACPFQRISNIVSNKTILNIAANAKTLHVIDFGILYGFPWPTLIHHLCQQPSGPPNLRITGIDLPQPGFRPSERVEETGRRLQEYAESFSVPFEYHAIAKKWESIEVEELKIDKEEVTIVYCMNRLKNLYDETIMEHCPRDIVLNLIRKINPTLFIHGVVNGNHNAPFFVTRFREALFHFSALFDMLDTIVPRLNQDRMLIEKDLFGWEALNSVACEGWERVERPETYKQWQVRNLRAGFEQVPLDRKIIKFVTDRVVKSYHKDFVMDEVSKWLLQGWKGRFLYALSTWKPA